VQGWIRRYQRLFSSTCGRPGARSCSSACHWRWPSKGAIRHMLGALGRHRLVLKTDIHLYYASMDHDLLIDRLGRRIQDPRLLSLLSQYLRRTVERGGCYWHPPHARHRARLLAVARDGRLLPERTRQRTGTSGGSSFAATWGRRDRPCAHAIQVRARVEVGGQVGAIHARAHLAFSLSAKQAPHQWIAPSSRATSAIACAVGLAGVRDRRDGRRRRGVIPSPQA
jgi:hypothetical protein